MVRQPVHKPPINGNRRPSTAADKCIDNYTSFSGDYQQRGKGVKQDPIQNRDERFRREIAKAVLKAEGMP
jgi:hypothetical protein